jgi:hypothetical protein
MHRIRLGLRKFAANQKRGYAINMEALSGDPWLAAFFGMRVLLYQGVMQRLKQRREGKQKTQPPCTAFYMLFRPADKQFVIAEPRFSYLLQNHSLELLVKTNPKLSALKSLPS